MSKGLMSDIDLASLVVRAQTGDRTAYDGIVRRFQDMAVGYASSLLGDFHLAEDAAQEAFVGAWTELPRLREPEAFPGVVAAGGLYALWALFAAAAGGGRG